MHLRRNDARHHGQAGQGDIGDDGANAEGLAWKTDIQRPSHETPSAIGADQLHGMAAVRNIL